MSESLPSHAQAVVVGGGIVGCSVAYHLAKLGLSDVVLIERETLTSGTTWHAAGVVGSLRASVFLTHLTVAACHLFPLLEQETGQSTGYRRTGGLSIAQTRERLEELTRVPGIGALTGYQGELLTPSEIKEKSPNLNVDDLTGGVWIPMDGQTNPTDTTMAFSKGARLHGARLFEHTEAVALHRSGRSLTGVSTDRGDISCEWLILCCGMWTRHLANRIDVPVPLQAVEHMYIVTEPMDDVAPDQPFIRDFDASIYIKGDAGKLLVGSVDPVSKPWSVSGIPKESAFTLLPEDWDHFEPFMEAALNRVPSLQNAGIRQFLNGPESFTVDARHVLGKAPGYDNLFVAAGFNTTGIMSSAGAGACIAEWIIDGQPPLDTWEADPRRFERWASTDAFIRARTFESPGLAFAMHWPYRQPETARNVKRSPIHGALTRAGACFGVVAGWEKPLYFAPCEVPPALEPTFGAQGWWPYAQAEASALLASAALFDQSQMAVFELAGRDSEAFLQRVCANNIAVETGRVVYTQMLNDRGGIEADITVTRLAADRFRLVTGAPNRVRDLDWIESQRRDEDVVVLDISANLGVLALMGPRSRDLLAALSTRPLDAVALPLNTLRTIDIGYATVEAQRLSYVGELGFELYIPLECFAETYHTLVETGASFGLRHAGLLCMDSCRIEKGYRHWGHELTPSITPLEAGLGFAVDFSKDFIGRDALLRQKEAGLSRRLMLFHLPTRPLLLHDEPIYRNGELVGETTSGACSFRVGGSVAFGYVRHPQGDTKASLMEGVYQIDVGGRRYDADILSCAAYDANGARMRA